MLKSASSWYFLSFGGTQHFRGERACCPCVTEFAIRISVMEAAAAPRGCTNMRPVSRNVNLPLKLAEKLNWCKGHVTSGHVTSIPPFHPINLARKLHRCVGDATLNFPLNLGEKLNCCMGHVISGRVTPIFSLNLAGQLYLCVGHGILIFPLNLVGKSNWCIGHVTSSHGTLVFPLNFLCVGQA